jgi:DNA-binding PadR family transcriptional regulator
MRRRGDLDAKCASKMYFQPRFSLSNSSGTGGLKRLKNREVLEGLNERNILRKLRRRFIKSFLDLIILDRVESAPHINGYAIIEYIFQKFNILVSSGSVYSTLYAMEREGLIKGVWNGRKREYSVTPKGKKIINAIRERVYILNSLFQEFITQKQEVSTYT